MPSGAYCDSDPIAVLYSTLFCILGEELPHRFIKKAWPLHHKATCTLNLDPHTHHWTLCHTNSAASRLAILCPAAEMLELTRWWMHAICYALAGDLVSVRRLDSSRTKSSFLPRKGCSAHQPDHPYSLVQSHYGVMTIVSLSMTLCQAITQSCTARRFACDRQPPGNYVRYVST